MSPLLSRIGVGAVGVPLVLGLAWLGGWWLVLLAGLGGLVALHEFWLMARSLRPVALAGYGGLICALLGAKLGGVDWLLGGFLVTLALAVLLQGIAQTRAPATVAIGSTVLGAAWIGLGLSSILLIRQLPTHGRLAVFAVLLAVWAADSLAFFAGRLIGRHKLAPVLSPGKTWEGFVAGVGAALFVTFVALYQDRKDFLSIWQALVLGLVIALAAAAGDLFESALKRDMHVKDTGRLLAGHGGMLDRIDSLLFAAPAAYYVIAAFGGA